jgi:hypothetical protein
MKCISALRIAHARAQRSDPGGVPRAAPACVRSVRAPSRHAMGLMIDTRSGERGSLRCGAAKGPKELEMFKMVRTLPGTGLGSGTHPDSSAAVSGALPRHAE